MFAKDIAFLFNIPENIITKMLMEKDLYTAIAKHCNINRQEVKFKMYGIMYLSGPKSFKNSLIKIGETK